ncbi:hypothetical protein [Agriterribacter sp.]|nr:hypothetical protein [Agriterribacter sp.]HRO45223.1 hypothetical protein [Agriterribacter sp.]HRQ16826.1 hypothetical protein [Agriterribacter sp.]
MKRGCLESNILPRSHENTKKIKPEDQDFVSLPTGRQVSVLVAYLL